MPGGLLADLAAFRLTVRSMVLLQVATLMTQLSFPPVGRHRALTPGGAAAT